MTVSPSRTRRSHTGGAMDGPAVWTLGPPAPVRRWNATPFVALGVAMTNACGELAVRLKRHTGRFTSKRFGFAPPSGEYLERVRAFYGPDVYPGAG